MSQTVLFCFDNYIDGTYLPPIIIGGAWDMPLSNLASYDLSTEVARSADLSLASTRFEVAFRQLRNINLSALPVHNMQRIGQYRLRYADTPAWDDLIVESAAIVGDAVISVRANDQPVALTSGQFLKFAGHDTVYEVLTTYTVGSGDTALITIDPALTAEVSALEVIECLNGNYSIGEPLTIDTTSFTIDTTSFTIDATTVDAAALYDTGWQDSIPEIYASMYPYWGHPSFWDGKPTDEDIAREKYPIVVVHENYVLAKFQLWEFRDETNTDGYIEIPRLFVSDAYQPFFNCAWGSSQSLKTDTTSKTTRNGKKVYDQMPTRKAYVLNIPDLPEDEIYSSVFDQMRRLGKHGQCYVVFNPEDTTHMHRRAFISTIEELPSISYDYHGGGGNGATYNAVSLSFQFEEVVA